MDMDQHHRPISDLTSQELLRRAVEYRRMAATARGQAVASALERLAIRFALLAARREVEEASHPSSSVIIHQGRSELDKLIQLAEQAAANEPDPVGALANAIKTVAEGNADPYLVMGVLIEGAAYLLDTRIPDERRADTAAALLQLVANRLRATGMLDRLA
jgi:hypothetical protein